MTEHTNTTSEAAKPPVVRPREVDAINDMRRTLEAIRLRHWLTNESDETRLVVHVEQAQNALFQILSTAHAYCDADISNYDMHEAWREEATPVVPEPQSIRV